MKLNWSVYHEVRDDIARHGCIVTGVTTRSLGSCRCGPCVARVFEDGTIRYEGNEAWQRSERFMPIFPLPRRPYDSQLTQEAYNKALAWAPKLRAEYERCRDA